MSTIVASAIDSPNCGMMIGTCGIKLFLEQRARFRSNQFRARPMRAPQIRMIRNRRVFGVHAYRRSIEQMKSFARYARDHLRGRATPRERFAHGKQPTGARDGCEYGISVERFH